MTMYNDASPSQSVTAEDAAPETSLLVIEDSDAVRKALCSIASNMGMFDHIYTAGDGFAGYQALRTHAVDVVLCDLQMPRCDGLGFLRLQQRDPRTSHIPVLVLTASEDQQSKIEALNAGACDFVSKPADMEEMRARLGAHLKLKRLYDDLQRKTQALERLTRIDGLTGVANRRHLDELLRDECARALRYGRPLSLVLIDIDYFKRLNDEEGHQAGDEALRVLGTMLCERVRAQDRVGRYGGEEFALVLPETSGRQARRVAERIRRAIEALEIHWNGRRLPITASLGVTELAVTRSPEPGDLIGSADAALYAAKREGRNRVVAAPGIGLPPDSAPLGPESSESTRHAAS